MKTITLNLTENQLNELMRALYDREDTLDTRLKEHPLSVRAKEQIAALNAVLTAVGIQTSDKKDAS